MRITQLPTLILASLSITALTASVVRAEEQPAPRQISYQKEVLPILQARCQGCHQPAKRGGGYDMTTFAQLLEAGESGTAAIVPGKPDESHLFIQITPVDGKAEMPKNGEPLSADEIAKIRLWIEQGAIDDSAAAPAGKIYDQDHPPVYSQPPVITSIAYSPDGQMLAVAGFHEVILRSADGQQLLARLIGLSERIESVAFSPDGTRLAVAGGQPGRMGELQIWDVPKRELLISIPLTNDTIYGASWSPDGSLVAVGASDTAVRAFNSQTGEQVFFNGAHDDWPLATVFSVDGSLLVSASRDMSTKLYNVPTQRFIDNVTSITPGALKGGISALQRHPERNEILVGGSDGTPRIYRMERVLERKIGDDSNLIRKFPAMSGRIYSVAYAPDGKTVACGSSLDGKGQVYTYNADAIPEAPEDIQAILTKMISGPTADELGKLTAYLGSNPQLLMRTKIELPAAVYAVAYHPQGNVLAAAGSDGKIRLINPADGTLVNEFMPVEVVTETPAESKSLVNLKPVHQEKLTGTESLPTGAVVTSLEVTPPSISLSGPYDSVQVLVTGVLQSGDRIDLTRLASLEIKDQSAVVSPLGRVFPRDDGTANLQITFESLQAAIPVEVANVHSTEPLSFIRDVNPVLTRLGCNQGTCHGSKDGKNGFKLSLRGYDPIYDVRAFTDDIKSRRTNTASPDDSLMLLKASGSVPHVGGQLTRPGEAYYEILRRWIAEGCQLDMDVERVASIQIEPYNPVVQNIGARQQLRVIATYTNGKTRDVTGDAFLESGNTEVAESNRSAVLTAVRRGEAPVLGRFEGSYAATTLTAMGERTGFVWKQPETWGAIDQLVAQKWERMKIEPSGLCDDSEFLRRVYLDLTGLPPSAEEVLYFNADPRPTQEKRAAVIDRLIGSDPYVEFWTNKWADLLQVNSKFLGSEGAALFRKWIREKVAANEPYDKFCYDVITAKGSNKVNPPASYYKILREPDALMENTTHLFLAIRFNCNKCHDHPFERWTQDQYYQTAAFFAQVSLKRDPANADGDIGGTAVEGAKPLWEEVSDNTTGEIKHDRTGAVTPPLVPFDREIPVVEEHDRREKLADWITSKDNDYFARSYVNRVWGYLMGVGLIEPIDDIRAGNPASNPELLDYLTAEFVNSGFNVRHLMAIICKSRTYQLSIATNKWNEDDRLNYSHATPKRLPAEVLYDTVYTVTGAKMQIPGVPEGTRAAALPDVQINLQDGFLDSLGRPVRESSCECERSSDLQLGPVMALMNGTTVSQAISQPGNRLEQLIANEPDDAAVINKVFLSILNRNARTEEIAATLKLFEELGPEYQKLVADRDAYRESSKTQQLEKEQKRELAIATLTKGLEDYRLAMQPTVEANMKAREERIAAAKKAIDDFNVGGPERIAKWIAETASNLTPWTQLKFTELTTTNNATLAQNDDLSVEASGEHGIGEYVLTSTLSLNQLANIRLEALSSDKLPQKGPGRANNGNFVVTEFVVEVWPKDHPEQKQQLKLKNAKASFSQENYNVDSAIDGVMDGSGNGWAVGPQTGKDHFATFEVETPVKIDGEMVVQIHVHQMFTDKMHALGKFRVSLTDQTGEVNQGLPASLLNLVKIAPEDRTPEQTATLLNHLNSQNEEFAKLTAALREAESPLPVDPKLTMLEEQLAEAQKPVPVDPQMARLDRAVELSELQLKNSRLTTVQDLAWALINSPAFLFNR
ncbi:DUF1549 domain-containing protein [Planctomicrobium sp. SH661]|uniref:DUF1549 domain-containing protein n=1 Tax=Planctomicrobium sp. SH661 TaxID=3448124 RepID=UPI003F5BFCDB